VDRKSKKESKYTNDPPSLKRMYWGGVKLEEAGMGRITVPEKKEDTKKKKAK
jgi:hypothetical protein